MQEKLRLVKTEPITPRQPTADQIKQIFAQRLFDFASPLYLVDKAASSPGATCPIVNSASAWRSADGVLDLLPITQILAEAE